MCLLKLLLRTEGVQYSKSKYSKGLDPLCLCQSFSVQVSLTEHQAVAIFTAIGEQEEELRLQNLNLSHNNLAAIPSLSLARAVVKLHEVSQ